MNSDDLQKAEIDQLIKERDALRKQVSLLQATVPDANTDVADNAPFGIAVVSAFKILYANRACRALFGHAPETAVQELEVMSFLDPRAWSMAAQIFQNTVPEQLSTPLHRQTHGRRQDGSIFPMSLSVIGISWKSHPAFLCYLADTEAKKNHEISRMKSVARRCLLQDAAKITAWDWNLAAGTLELDDAMLATLALAPTPHVRNMFRALLRKVLRHDRRPLLRQIFTGLRCGHMESSPFCFMDRSGQTRVAMLHAQCISGKQIQPCTMIGIIRDISEAYSSAQALLQARADAQCAEVAKDRFISNISHELRTPLNGILGMLQLMGNENGSDEFRKHLSLAIMSGKNLLQTINDILELSNSGNASAANEMAGFSPWELLTAGCEAFRQEAEEKHLRLTCDVELPPEATYRGDAGLLGHILRNLLANSIKFTRQGCIVVHGAIIHANRERHRLLISVSDTGIGIPDAKLTRVFEPFSQADDSPTRPFQGAGLGLGLVRRHIARMGGTLSVSSEEHLGTTICLSVDLIPNPPAGQPARKAPGVSRCRKILLAEDNHINQVLAETVLRRIGYEVRPVHNGHEVLRALEEDEFGCILMDIQMPGMSGIEATRRIRASQKEYARVPIIALTAHALQGDRERILASGMDGYLAKPVSISELKKIVASVMPPETEN